MYEMTRMKRIYFMVVDKIIFRTTVNFAASDFTMIGHVDVIYFLLDINI
jgi:hypothetical protein